MQPKQQKHWDLRPHDLHVLVQNSLHAGASGLPEKHASCLILFLRHRLSLSVKAWTVLGRGTEGPLEPCSGEELFPGLSVACGPRPREVRLRPTWRCRHLPPELLHRLQQGGPLQLPGKAGLLQLAFTGQKLLNGGLQALDPTICHLENKRRECEQPSENTEGWVGEMHSTLHCPALETLLSPVLGKQPYAFGSVLPVTQEDYISQGPLQGGWAMLSLWHLLSCCGYSEMVGGFTVQRELTPVTDDREDSSDTGKEVELQGQSHCCWATALRCGA